MAADVTSTGKKTTRRRFLVVALVGVVLLIGGLAYRWIGQHPGVLAWRLRRELSYLDLRVTDEQLESVIAEFQRRGRTGFDGLVVQLLLSTDFFVHGADEKRPVSFVAYYDPYSAPGWNPLVRRG